MSLLPHKLIIIAAPSGAGKTSIVKHLLSALPDQLGFSVSCATRTPRTQETDGVDYYFITADAFTQRVAAGEFVEWEMVYEGKYYGTLRSELERIWQLQQTPLLDIDVKGGLKIKAQYPQSLSVFIEPPSLAVLRERLAARGTETEASLQVRLDKASEECSYRDRFDHVIINDQLGVACAQALQLVQDYLSK
ncbi:MAG: guanylate kinase [Sphingomonadales bacterium]|nr:guanylate kinase [Sphingomonadales bacterium]